MQSRTDGPFATLERRVSGCRDRAGAKQPRTIVIQAGDYFLDEPVVLTPEDNGLTIEAAPGAKACLYGGREVSGWEPDGDGLYAASRCPASKRARGTSGR